VWSIIKKTFEIVAFYAVGISAYLYLWPLAKKLLNGQIYSELGFGFIWLTIISNLFAYLRVVLAGPPAYADWAAENEALGSVSDDGFRALKQGHAMVQLRVVLISIMAISFLITVLMDRSIHGDVVLVGGTAVYVALWSAEKVMNFLKKGRADKAGPEPTIPRPPTP